VVCQGPRTRLRRAMKLTLGGIKYPEMIRVTLTDAAYDAIASSLPTGAARWPMQRDRGQCFIRVEAGVVKPHEGHAQARRDLQPSHPAARQIGVVGNQNNAQFAGIPRVASGLSLPRPSLRTKTRISLSSSRLRFLRLERLAGFR
jgi:hypothetical protein